MSPPLPFPERMPRELACVLLFVTAFLEKVSSSVWIYTYFVFGVYEIAQIFIFNFLVK